VRDLRGSSCCAVALAAALLLLAHVPMAMATSGSSGQPRPQHLWRTYPLDPSRTKRQAPAAGPHRASPRAADAGGRGESDTTLLMAVGLGGAALVAAFAVLGQRRYSAVVGLARRERGPLGRRRSHRTEGGLTMSNAGRRLWGRGERSDSEIAEERVDDDAYASPGERIAHYAGGDETTAEAPTGAAEDTAVGRGSELVNVGAEVEAVLASARDAAARILASAEAEASRVREQATAAATEELADATAAVADARDEADRVRDEAETYAEETRRSANTAAEDLRAEAEGQAAGIVEAARARLAEADDEAEQKLRELEGTARKRADHLEAATERHEARLESMLAVFRGVCSELEELLDTGEEAGADDAGEGSIDSHLRLNIVRANED
jgi:F0F1-type ATP synthase membrane subunit b/b'